MKVDLKRLGPAVYRDLVMLGKDAQQRGWSAFLVGGIVRDLFLKRKSLDWDIVVEGDALALARHVAGYAKGRLQAYPQFGTATVTLPQGVVLDFVTARSEHYPHPGALPVVKPAGLREDLFRRDFTINALAVSLAPQTFGELQDFFGGYQDLIRKKVRVLHDQSFVDDATRILRAVRFAGRLRFRIEAHTLKLLKDALGESVPETIKPPRYFAELRKICSEENFVACVRMLAEFKGLEIIAPGFVPDMKCLKRLERSMGQLRRDPFYRGRDYSRVVMTGLLSPLSSAALHKLGRRCHLTREEQFTLAGLSQADVVRKQLSARGLRPSAVYEILDPLDLEIIYFIRLTTSVKIIARRIDDFLKKWRLVSLEITGRDLQFLGLTPGKSMGAVLHTLLMKKMDGQAKDRKSELALAKTLVVNYQRS